MKGSWLSSEPTTKVQMHKLQSVLAGSTDRGFEHTNKPYTAAGIQERDAQHKVSGPLGFTTAIVRSLDLETSSGLPRWRTRVKGRHLRGSRGVHQCRRWSGWGLSKIDEADWAPGKVPSCSCIHNCEMADTTMFSVT